MRHHDREFELIQWHYLPQKTMGQVWAMCGVEVWEGLKALHVVKLTMGACLLLKTLGHAC